MQLSAFFDAHPNGALALSGGVDSALLAWAAGVRGRDWRAYFVHTPFQPAFELADARAIARQCGLPLTVVELDTLESGAIAANGPDRCYHCKRLLFSALRGQAAADGFTLLIDGTNASDDGADRPGMRALQELSVRSPLRECGLTKQNVRRMSRLAGLPTWDKPAYACLATRIPTGTALTADALQAVERAEDALYQMGFRDFRVRVRGQGALVQLTAEQFPLAAQRRDELLWRLRLFFREAALDLTPRTPSR